MSVTRCFQKYSSSERADRAASFRMGHRQREAVGEFYYITDAVPNRAFPTRKEALQAEATATVQPQGDHCEAVVQSRVSPTAAMMGASRRGRTSRAETMGGIAATSRVTRTAKFASSGGFKSTLAVSPASTPQEPNK